MFRPVQANSAVAVARARKSPMISETEPMVLDTGFPAASIFLSAASPSRPSCSSALRTASWSCTEKRTVTLPTLTPTGQSTFSFIASACAHQAGTKNCSAISKRRRGKVDVEPAWHRLQGFHYIEPDDVAAHSGALPHAPSRDRIDDRAAFRRAGRKFDFGAALALDAQAAGAGLVAGTALGAVCRAPAPPLGEAGNPFPSACST